MIATDRRTLERDLQRAFPTFELDNWYIQYRQLKAGAPDAVLFYRMGDFYEAFDDDAKLVAELLDVTLTYKKFAKTRGTKDEQRCPMAGMPYHAVERYVAGLIGAGYRVAIAEQISETASSRADTRPKSVFAGGLEQSAVARGMVERKIVRVITPGTVTDTGLLPVAENNYLVAAIAHGGRVGLAYADLSTGEFAATEFGGDRALLSAQGELARLTAAEVLTPEDTALRLTGVDPADARLTRDLEFMTKEEREHLLPGERVARRTERENTARWAHGHITAWPTWRWEPRTAREALLRLLRVQSLAGFGLADKPLAARAAGALAQYVQETQNGATANMTSLRAYTTGDVMFLDPQTRRNLELLEGSGGKSKGSLVAVLDQTRTPMGARLLRRWVQQPLLDLAKLNARQAAVAHFVDDAIERASVREQLKLVGDMERAANRVIQGTLIALPRDLVRLRDALRALPALTAALDGWLPPAEHATAPTAADADPLAEADGPAPEQPRPAAPRAQSLREQRESRGRSVARYADQDDLFGDLDDTALPESRPALRLEQAPPPSPAAATPPRLAANAAAAAALDPCADLLALLERALDDDPPALLGASNYLRAAEESGEKPRRVIRPGFEPTIDQIVKLNRRAQQYVSGLEERERERTGIKNLRVDYNKVFGYYIEVSKINADRVPDDYVRKQTLTSGERYFTEELKRVEETLASAQEQLLEAERRAFNAVCAEVAAQGERLIVTARTLAAVDVYAGLAEAAVRGRYVRPSLHADTRLRITAGRHPVVEQMLGGQFVPNDAQLDTEDHQVLLVTGPNMAGKSTVMRQIALTVLLAQIGAFVPADAAEIGLVDRIFTRIGAQDDIATGQSTFMVEMTETAALLSQSSHRSLIVLDEVGRGTSTYDGMAIARAVVEYIHNEPRLGCRTLFATHYHELTALAELLPRVQNYHMAAVERDGGVVFLHELRPGRADRSYGIHVAELAGIPAAVIRRATALLAELEAQDSAPATAAPAAPSDQGQLGLFDSAPNPVIELLRRLQINELSPLDALTRLYELQQLAQRAR